MPSVESGLERVESTLKSLIVNAGSSSSLIDSPAEVTELRKDVCDEIKKLIENGVLEQDPQVAIDALKAIGKHEVDLLESKRRTLDSLVKAYQALGLSSTTRAVPAPSNDIPILNPADSEPTEDPEYPGETGAKIRV